MAKEKIQPQIDVFLKDILDFCHDNGLGVTVISETSSGPFMYEITRPKVPALEPEKVSEI